MKKFEIASIAVGFAGFLCSIVGNMINGKKEESYIKEEVARQIKESEEKEDE